jgi:hypothetical protein
VESRLNCDGRQDAANIGIAAMKVSENRAQLFGHCGRRNNRTSESLSWWVEALKCLFGGTNRPYIL